MPFLCLHAAGKDGLMKDEIFSVLQRVGRSFMLPVAVLPIAGILLGIGASFTNPTTPSAWPRRSARSRLSRP